MELENGSASVVISFPIGYVLIYIQQLLISQITEDIRLKACRLFGIQRIEVYNGFKGGLDEINAVSDFNSLRVQEYEKNKKTGMKEGLWVGNVLLDKRFGLLCKQN